VKQLFRAKNIWSKKNILAENHFQITIFGYIRSPKKKALCRNRRPLTIACHMKILEN
jgi:hypothetical protein